MDTRCLLEICIASVEDALAARDGGADRLELNAALGLGGLSPSLGMLMEVRREVPLPLIVMARPRPGGFAYSAVEYGVMQRDIEVSLAHGADGIAFGVLCEDGTLDIERVRELVQLIGEREAVFHRAFDVTPDPVIALEALIDAGVKRVMTSGQEETALAGADLIAALIRQARGRIEILPAAGIKPATIAEVRSRTGCEQVHASLRETRPDRSTMARPRVRFGSASNPPEDRFDATSADVVRQVRRVLDVDA